LKDSIASSTAKVPDVQSDIEEGEAQVAQLGEDLKKHQADRAAAKAAMAEATALREKEAAAYAAVKEEANSQISAINKAVAAIEGGGGGAFLQTSAADVLRKLVQSKENMVDADRDEITSFLAASQESEYAPASGQITGILKTMGDEMNANLAEATKNENEAIKSFNGLIAAKKKEVAACTKAIEEKTVRVGELKVSIVQLKQELSDTEAALVEDKKFIADLKKRCATETAKWEEICKTRNEELLALADTIKVLNDDDALDLFKKTLPSASLLQVTESAASLRARALSMLKRVKRGTNPSFDFIELALRGKKIGFEKVFKMIDELVAVLKTEQKSDDDKKAYCEKKFDEADDTKKAQEKSIADDEAAIADAQDTIATLKTEIEALDDGIRALDKQVADLSGDLATVTDELSAVNNGLDKLKEMCVAKAEPYAERKARRESEIAGLKEALEILEGEAALIQKATKRTLRGLRRH